MCEEVFIKQKKGTDGNIINATNLREMTSNLPCFKQEIKFLQYQTKQLGVSIDSSSKYYPKIAGKGIKFCWGAAKNTYCRFFFKEKRTKIAGSG